MNCLIKKSRLCFTTKKSNQTVRILIFKMQRQNLGQQKRKKNVTSKLYHIQAITDFVKILPFILSFYLISLFQ